MVRIEGEISKESQMILGRSFRLVVHVMITFADTHSHIPRITYTLPDERRTKEVMCEGK